MILAWYDPTNHHVSTDKHDPLFTQLGQLWPLHRIPLPLTKEAVGLLIGNSLEAQSWLMSVVRAVEKAHGIGEKE